MAVSSLFDTRMCHHPGLNLDGAWDEDEEKSKGIRIKSEVDYSDGEEQNYGAFEIKKEEPDEMIIKREEDPDDMVFIKKEDDDDEAFETSTTGGEADSMIPPFEVDPPAEFVASSPGFLADNKRQMINGKLQYVCTEKDCEEVFPHKEHLFMHTIFFHMKPYCPTCDQFFNTKDEKQIHDNLLHNSYSCTDCKAAFPTTGERNDHCLSEHGVYLCVFCNYLVPKLSLQIHMSRNHKIDDYMSSITSKNYQIIYGITKLTMRCSLCHKKQQRSKIYNHLRFKHNILLGVLATYLVNAEFTLDPEIYDKLPDVIVEETRYLDEEQSKTSSKNMENVVPSYTIDFPEKSKSVKLPPSSYDCPVEGCTAQTTTTSSNDYGFHLLIIHELVYCSKCNLFFKSLSDRKVHNNFAHRRGSEVCSVCKGTFGNAFALMDHRNSAHGMSTCILCEDLILTVPESFQTHVKQTHNIKNNAIISPVSKLMEKLMNCTLISSDKENSKVSCKLCINTVFEYGDSGGLRDHLSTTHQVRNFDLFFSSFDGENFNLKSLADLDVFEKDKNERNKHDYDPLQQMYSCIYCLEKFDDSLGVQEHLLTCPRGKKSEGNEKEKRSTNDDSEDITIKQEFCSETKDLCVMSMNEEDHEEEEGESDDEDDDGRFKLISLEDIKKQGLTVEDDGCCDPEPPLEPEVKLNEGEPSWRPFRALVPKKLFLRCEMCSAILKSVVAFNAHMKKVHPESEQEKNKPFRCEICGKTFYFEASMNSHISRAHHTTTGTTYRCDICPTVTNSKASLKRHLIKVHKSSVTLSEEYGFKCRYCDKLFWSLAERTQHMSEEHKEAQGELQKCFVCCHISPNKYSLRRHFKRMHPTEPLFENVSYKCCFCSVLFPRKTLLQEHVKTLHKDVNVYQCGKCNLKLKSLRGLRKHSLIHDRPKVEKTFTCNICGKTVDSKRALTNHTALSHTGKETGFGKILKVKCRLCEDTFESKVKRDAHYDIAHPGQDPYVCGVCDMTFPNKGSWSSHKMRHNPTGPHKCDYCAKEFNRRDSFNEHLLIHTGPRYRCPHCPKEFVQKSNLKRHIRIHLGIKPYKCTKCDASFSDSAACKSHVLIHENVKQTCEVCGQVFARKQKLRYHMRIHTGEGLLTCEICGRAFTNSYSMKKHLHTHSSKKPVFECSQCTLLFDTVKKLNVHLKNEEKLPLQCSECGLEFNSESEHNTHIFSIHRKNGVNTGYKCRHCPDVSYFSMTDIREHLTQTHEVTKDFSFHFFDGFRNEPALELDLMDQDKNNGNNDDDGDEDDGDGDEEWKEFPSTSKRKSPRQQQQQQTAEVQCSFCGAGFPNSHLFIQHMKKAHQYTVDGLRLCQVEIKTENDTA